MSEKRIRMRGFMFVAEMFLKSLKKTVKSCMIYSC